MQSKFVPKFTLLQQEYYSNYIKPESTESELLNWIIFAIVRDNIPKTKEQIQAITQLSIDNIERGIGILLYSISKTIPFIETNDNRIGTKTGISINEVAWSGNNLEQEFCRMDMAINKKICATLAEKKLNSKLQGLSSEQLIEYHIRRRSDELINVFSWILDAMIYWYVLFSQKKDNNFFD